MSRLGDTMRFTLTETPYDVLRLLIENGGKLTLREAVTRLERGIKEGSDLDHAIAELENCIESYNESCTSIGEEPVVSVSPVSDEVITPLGEVPFYGMDDLEGTLLHFNAAMVSYYVRSMPWSNFELLCKELFENMGFADVRLTDKGPDGGIDFTGTFFEPNFREICVPIIGQIKRWSINTPIGAKEIREFIGKLAIDESPATQGYFITTSYYSEQAKAEAKKSRKKLNLWGMKELINGLLSCNVGTVQLPPVKIIDKAHWDRYLED